MSRRAGRYLALALLVWTAAALVRSLATLPDRGGRAGLAGLEPFLWQRRSPEVLALERFLAAHGGALGRGETVLVVGDAGPGVDASFVWHWCQYLAPRPNFVWRDDAAAGLDPAYVLAWGPIPPDPEWRAVASAGATALYRVRRR